jgi:ATP-dependent helicase Lhr and Lhr-like helicase
MRAKAYLRRYDVLCRNGPFGSISPSQFVQILRAIGNRETGLIEQAADGSLFARRGR